MTKQELMTHLESLSNSELPPGMYKYNKQQLVDLVEYADSVCKFQNAGLDKLFDAISQCMKYIPKFVLVSLAKRFLEAPLAARITRRLTLKQAASMGNELAPEYLAEVTFFQEPELSANILGELKSKQAKAILSCLADQHPLKVLDIFCLLPEELQGYSKEVMNESKINREDLHSLARKSSYEKIFSL